MNVNNSLAAVIKKTIIHESCDSDINRNIRYITEKRRHRDLHYDKDYFKTFRNVIEISNDEFSLYRRRD